MKILAWLIGLPAGAIALFFVWASAPNTRRENYSQIIHYRDLSGHSPRGEFTLVTYNLGYLSGMMNNGLQKPERDWFESNMEEALRQLKSVSPDLVTLQEIDVGAWRSYGVDQAAALANGLALGKGAITLTWDKRYVPFPYWPVSAQFGQVRSGQALLSALPIEETRRIVLPSVTGKPFYFKAFYLDRVVQVSTVLLGEQPVVVMNVHLEAYEEATRQSQVEIVRSLAEEFAQTHPVVVAGDFNSALNRKGFETAIGQPGAEIDHTIKTMMASPDLSPVIPFEQWESPEAATFPSDAPTYKLDYIFYTPKTLTLLNAQVLRDDTAAVIASDHLPLMARFQLETTVD